MDMADEVAGSLTLGDHRNLGRLTIRGVLGLAVIAAGSLQRRRRVVLGEPDVVFVVASAVAHGARMVGAAAESLSGLDTVMVADRRLAEMPIDVHGPSLGFRSLRAIVHRRAVLDALRLRMRAGGKVRALSGSRVYAEYLFLAQAIRYQAASDALRDVPARTIVLTDFDRHAYSRPWIWAANQRRLHTVTLVHGSPNSNYVPVLARTVLTWGEAQSEWFGQHSPDATATVVGRLDLTAHTRPPKPLARVVICHSAETLSEDESTRLIAVISEVRQRGVRSLVRLHPSSDTATGLWADVANAADDVITTREPFSSSLQPGDGVICVTSTALVDAMVAGFPVAVVADSDRELPVDLAPMRTHTPVAQLDAGPPMPESVVATTGAAAGARLRAALDRIGSTA